MSFGADIHMSSIQARELSAAVAQAQLDAMRHGWSHVSCSGWRFSAHAVPSQHGVLMDLYCEDDGGHIVWSKTNCIYGQEFVE